MYIANISEESIVLYDQPPFRDKINVFMQFFIHPNNERQQEFLICLDKNISNPDITHIYLLNEQHYPMFDTNSKIIQVNIGHRLKYSDVFLYINTHNITGFNIIMNSDIFLDNTIENLFKTNIHLQKKMYALLRYDVVHLHPFTAQLFGPRPDSQDCWILHSNFHITNHEAKVFNFELGMPGCDNKLLFLMQILGYQVLNDPEFIKTFHLHSTQIRNYTEKDRVHDPYAFSIPRSFAANDEITKHLLPYNVFTCNRILSEYVTNKLQQSSPFIIPRLSQIESNISVFVALSNNRSHPQRKQLLAEIPKMFTVLKHNAGIRLSNIQSAQRYAELYLRAFHNCELYANWCPHDAVHKSSHQPVIEHMFPAKQTIYALTYDIYTCIHSNPWTLALRGQRVLFISPFAELIEAKKHIRKELYGIDLFPDCEIVTLKPPQTQGLESSEEFHIELGRFFNTLETYIPHFDVALVSAGGYGNLICNQIYELGKSAIYVGGVLQMYWGIVGQRWLTNQPDMIRLYLNHHWSRPSPSDRPSNYKAIENGCYW